MVKETPFRSERALVLCVPAVALLTGLVWLLGQGLHDITLLPDAGAAWYYWKLPEPTAWTRLSAWLGYAAHQIVSWGLILHAQRHARRYTRGLKRINVVALGANLGFVALHALQTQVFYDGLAQDVSIFSSQGSVILLLVAVLLMENRRRGLVVGRRVPMPAAVVDVVRHYHGYLFSWAVVYTFWYHPMEATTGHLIGFFYVFLLLVQSSLMFTTAHTNRVWTVTLEVLVAVHGTLVAVMNSGPDGLWPMFLFGFLAVFVLTQMHGLGLGSGSRWAVFAAFTAAVVGVYSWRGFDRIDEIVRIPLILYLLIGVLILLIWPFTLLLNRRPTAPEQAAPEPASPEPATSDSARPDPART